MQLETIGKQMEIDMTGEAHPEDMWAIPLGVLSTSLITGITDAVAEVVVEKVGMAMFAFLKERHPEFDEERFRAVFEIALLKAADRAEMDLLLKQVEEDHDS